MRARVDDIESPAVAGLDVVRVSEHRPDGAQLPSPRREMDDAARRCIDDIDAAVCRDIEAAGRIQTGQSS